VCYLTQYLFHLFDYIRLALKKFLEQKERQKGLTNQSSDTEDTLERELQMEIKIFLTTNNMASKSSVFLDDISL